jgi:uncharacterized protein (TIGR03067 family)
MWTLVEMDEKGRRVTAEELKEEGGSFVFRGNELLLKERGVTKMRFSFTLDPAKAPRHIDLQRRDRATRGTCHAIYSLEKGVLKVCVGTNFNPGEPEERPQEFATKLGSEGRPPKGKLLFVIKRSEEWAGSSGPPLHRPVGSSRSAVAGEFERPREARSVPKSPTSARFERPDRKHGKERRMDVPLTEQQQQLLDAEKTGPPRLVDPRTSTTYVLVPEADYEAVREILEDERRQRAIRAVGLRNAAGRVDEGP